MDLSVSIRDRKCIVVMVTSPTKYVLCFPLSGLNDLLNRVWKAFVYAREHDRVLVIDSRYSFLCDAFDNYFDMSCCTSVTTMSVSHFYDILETKHASQAHSASSSTAETENTIIQSSPLSIFPHGLSIQDFRSRLRPRLQSIDRRVHAVWNGIILSTSLDASHSEDIVVYSSCGGGPSAIRIFEECQLSNDVLELYRQRRAKLPESYHAIHIRNTDKRSEGMDTFLASMHDILVSSPVFVASDDANILLQLRQKYENVFTFANIPALVSVNIHYHHPSVPTKEFNLDSIVDVLLLASATTFTFSCPSSGYSKLANALFQRKHVLHRLVKSTDP